MVITYCTVDKIDKQVLNGLPMGYFGTDDDLSTIPAKMGDWFLKTALDSYRPGVGLIVAVPSNKRTRLIYKQGRLRWLDAIGFSKSLAYKYYKASEGNAKRWDNRVAKFVADNSTIDSFILDEILESELPRRTCLDNGIYTTLNHGLVLASCNIIKRIQAL